MKVYQRFLCHWYYSLCFFLYVIVFPSVTLHFVSSSYLKYNVGWLEFICLCSSHHFRYFIHFLLKLIWNSSLMLCINGLFPRLSCFTWIKLNDCDDVIILPLMKLMYTSLWYPYMYVNPYPMVMWFFQPYIKKFKCYFISDPVKSVLRDPSLEENTSFFLKWFCYYLGVYLLQPGYILSANSSKYYFLEQSTSFESINSWVLVFWPYPDSKFLLLQLVYFPIIWGICQCVLHCKFVSLVLLCQNMPKSLFFSCSLFKD